MKRSLIVLLMFLLLTTIRVQSSQAMPRQPSWSTKVASQVLSEAQNGKTEFILILQEQADLSHAESLETKLDKGTYVFETLTEFAEKSQKPIRAILDTVGAEYQPFWVANMILVRGDYEILQQMAQRTDVAKVEANPSIPIRLPVPDQSYIHPQAVNGIEWNILKINAPKLWALGYTGQGIVVAGQDTGYDWDHNALIGKYRGWDGTSTDHNYNWHDAIEGTSEPIDPHWHGTHTMGIMVGDDGDTNQIGVAPGAEWIGCRNMDATGYGTPASYTECYQWFIAPTDLDGNNPDPTKSPHVINNSWGCLVSEGCTTPDILLGVVQAVRAAGIVTVHSAGNSGSSCYTVNEPAAIYAESFTVGATYSNDTITNFSSRGSVTVDGSNRLKPDVTAPGYNIRSSIPGNNYLISSGTSMAAPHVAGLVALLLSANPNLIGQVDKIENIIESTSLPRTSTQTCGGVPGSAIPNNTFGWGRVDAWSAIHASIIIFYYPIIFR